MSTEGDEDVCWICLCSSEGNTDLQKVCGCPRKCHPDCLARWQLQQAGRREERFCRFCEQEYPDWKNALTPREIKPTTPIMAVSVRGRVHKLRVRPGPEGKEDFKRQVRQLLGYSDDMEFDVIFECKTPHSGEKVQLQGFSAFDAATHCAAVSAAKRLKNKQHQKHQHKQRRQQQSDDGSGRSGDVASRKDGITDGSTDGSSSRSYVAGGGQGPDMPPSTPAEQVAGAAMTAAVSSSGLPTDISRLQAQYQHYMLQRQQQSMFGLAGSTRLSPSVGGIGTSSTGGAPVSPSSRTSSSSSESWGLLSSNSSASAVMLGETAATRLAHIPGTSRSVSTGSADASAMLTAGDISSGAGAASVPAGDAVTCPSLPYSLLATAAGAPVAPPTVAEAGGDQQSSLVCHSSLTEPQPAVQFGNQLLQPQSLGAVATVAGALAGAAAGGAGTPVTDGVCGSDIIDISGRKMNKVSRWFQRITARQRC